jgi:hypothetical protein
MVPDQVTTISRISVGFTGAIAMDSHCVFSSLANLTGKHYGAKSIQGRVLSRTVIDCTRTGIGLPGLDAVQPDIGRAYSAPNH